MERKDFIPTTKQIRFLIEMVGEMPESKKGNRNVETFGFIHSKMVDHPDKEIREAFPLVLMFYGLIAVTEVLTVGIDTTLNHFKEGGDSR
jgi:hypothetical protein